MNLYLDTSSLLKLYLEEHSAAATRRLFDEADAIGTSLITYVEARAALARAWRAGRLDQKAYKAALRGFELSWTGFISVDVSESLVRQAGELAERHELRGYDAVQLASALVLKREIGESVVFSASDDRLMEAALSEGLTPGAMTSA